MANQFLELEYSFSRLFIDAVVPGQDSFDPALKASFDNLAISLMCFIIYSSIATMHGIGLTGNRGKYLLAYILVSVFVLQLVFVYSGNSVRNTLSLLISVSLAFYTGSLLKKLGHLQSVSEVQKDVLDEREKELAQAQLTIIKADEIDRRVLAADLHDQVLHGLKMVRQKIHDYHKSPCDSDFEEIDQGIARSMDEIREVMDSLSPSALENLSFAEAIEEIIRKGSGPGEFRVRFRSDVEESEFERLSNIEKTLLYRIVQESVNNIIKHAGASKVRCLISKREGKLHITIADNGKGFDTSVQKSGSRGVQYMLQRAGIINASIDWRPAEKGNGCVVDVSI